MKLTYQIMTLDETTTTYTNEEYEFWIVISGSFQVTVGNDLFPLKNHDLLHIPTQKELHIVTNGSVTIGRIQLYDFMSTNADILILPSTETELIRRFFFFALEISGSNQVYRKRVMPNIDEIMLEFLLSPYQISEPNPAVLSMIHGINDNYLNSDFSVYQNLERYGYSQSHLRKLFHENVGISPMEFLMQRRIEYAKKLLRQNEDLTIKEISNQSGFENSYYFSRTFKKRVGMTPSEYKQIKHSD